MEEYSHCLLCVQDREGTYPPKVEFSSPHLTEKVEANLNVNGWQLKKRIFLLTWRAQPPSLFAYKGNTISLLSSNSSTVHRLTLVCRTISHQWSLSWTIHQLLLHYHAMWITRNITEGAVSRTYSGYLNKRWSVITRHAYWNTALFVLLWTG